MAKLPKAIEVKVSGDVVPRGPTWTTLTHTCSDLIDTVGKTDCEVRHLSQIYCVEPNWAKQFVRTVDLKGGVRRSPTPVAASDESIPINPYTEKPLFDVAESVGVVEVVGPILKGNSKFSDANSIMIRKALRILAQRDSIRGILLVVDSPGGMVAGIEELALDVRVAASRKPLHVHVDDLAASAAVWMIAQPGVHITANSVAEVGSIGVYAVIEDSSAKAEAEGIVVHVVSTGDMKGAGVPGTKITEEMLAEVQERVDAVNEFFIASVAEGRSLEKKAVRAIADGRVFGAADAKKLGLIDAVASMDDSFARLRKKTERASGRMRNARAAIALSEAEHE